MIEISHAPLRFPLPSPIHFIGICGKGMSALAIALHRLGVAISGSDEDIYGESRHSLATVGIFPHQNFAAANLSGAKCVVISRNYSRENVEVEEALTRRIPIFSFPEFLSVFLLPWRRNLIVAGIKGKTTTTAMLVAILAESNLQPNWLIGGTPVSGMPAGSFSGGDLCVIEGDDYESSFWNGNPKFTYYRPEAAILTNVFPDHPEVHSNDDHMVANFRQLLCQIPRGGVLITGSRSELTLRCAATALCPRVSVGYSGEDDVCIEAWRQQGAETTFEVRGTSFRLPLTGRYNAINAASSALMAERYGVSLADSARILAEFRGVHGRQELIGTANGISVYCDLAYLPQSLETVSESFRLRNPPARLVLLYQPFIVNTMPGIEPLLANAMSGFDLVMLADAYKLKIMELKNAGFSAGLKPFLDQAGIRSEAVGPIEDALPWIAASLLPGDVVVSVLHPRALHHLPMLLQRLASQP